MNLNCDHHELNFPLNLWFFALHLLFVGNTLGFFFVCLFMKANLSVLFFLGGFLFVDTGLSNAYC